MYERLPHVDDLNFTKLLAYAIAGSGFYNMKPVLANFSPTELPVYQALFSEWLDGRDLPTFYETLFEDYGYTCEEVGLR